MNDTQSSLELSPEYLRFEETDPNSVFFDDGNHQVIVFREGKTTGVILKCDTNKMSTNVLCLDLAGQQPILAIKFSLDNKLIAIQRCEKSLQIFRYDPDQPQLTVLLTTKKFNHKIVDFVWINSVELMVAAVKQLDLYRFEMGKVGQLVHQRTVACPGITWFRWCKFGHLALVASQNGAVLTPLAVKQSGTLEKLTPLTSKAMAIAKTDVTLTHVYETKTIVVITRTTDGETEIELYQPNDNSIGFKIVHVLRLGAVGKDVKLQVVDNLIVTHDPEYHSTYMFDILMDSEERAGVHYHSPIAKQRVLSQSQMGQGFDYSQSLFLAPNVLVAPKLGHMWRIKLNLTHLCQSINAPVQLFDILLRRENSKPCILALVKHISIKFDALFSSPIQTIFDRLNQINKNQAIITQTESSQVFMRATSVPKVIIGQDDMFESVLSEISNPKHCEYVLLIYLNSLAVHDMQVCRKWGCFVVQTLTASGNLATLELLLRSNTIRDSKTVVKCLLGKAEENLLFLQLALDILHRLEDYEKIFQVLIENNKVMDAISLAVRLKKVHLLNKEMCLTASQRCPMIQHSVEMFFYSQTG